MNKNNPLLHVGVQSASCCTTTTHGDGHDHASDRGVTLMELLMVMVITSVVGALVLATLITVGNLVRRTTERTEEFIDAKLALEEMTANLRGASNYEQGRGRLTDATSQVVVFFTNSGEGLTKAPTLMSYIVHDGNLYRVMPHFNPTTHDIEFDEHTPKSLILSGLRSNDIFEYYTWQHPDKFKPGAPPTQHNCFRKLTEAELTLKNPQGATQGDAADGLHARNAVALVKISLRVRDRNNLRFKDTQRHTTWVRLGEAVEPKDPKTGALIDGWPKSCWETINAGETER